MNKDDFIIAMQDFGYKYSERESDTNKSLFFKQTATDIICQCNDRAPSFHVYFYDEWFREHHLNSVEIEIVAEDISNDWLVLKIYSIKPEDFIEKADFYERKLLNLWVSNHSYITNMVSE